MLDALFEGNDETLLEVPQTQLSLSPIVNTPAYTCAAGNRDHQASPTASVAEVVSSQRDTLSMAQNVTFRAHQPSPALESEMESSSADRHRASQRNLDISPERALALKQMYIGLIRELHQLLTSGAISEVEYKMQKDVILVQMLSL